MYIYIYINKKKSTKKKKAKKPCFAFVARFHACVNTYSRSTSARGVHKLVASYPPTHSYLYRKDVSGTACAKLECPNEHHPRYWLRQLHMHMYLFIFMCSVQLCMRYLASNDSQEVPNSNIHCSIAFNTLGILSAYGHIKWQLATLIVFRVTEFFPNNLRVFSISLEFDLKSIEG